MEDFYPVRSENIPELFLLAKEPLADKDMWGLGRKENVISFLLPLVIDLLDDVERIKSLKRTFQEEYGGESDIKLSAGFRKIVEAYLEENNGTGNLLLITEVLRSNDHKAIAVVWEKFLLRYSLPVTSEGGGDVNAYSLSRDFLSAEKKEMAGDSVTMCITDSVGKALQNSVILEEIFKKLQLGDQKLFRLVSPTWLEETFPFWRRNARILIHVSTNGYYNELRCGILLPTFVDFWIKNRKTFDKVAKGDVQTGITLEDTVDYKLQDHPFRSYQVSYKNFMRGTNVFSCEETENIFWKSCGQFIEDLEIKHNSISTKICQRLLQEFCQNLKRLKISSQDWVNIPEDSSSSEDEKETKPDKKNQANSKSDRTETKLNFNYSKRMPIAENLHTLYLSYIDEESLRSILFICPNLKTLVLDTYEETLGALLSPTSTGEFIKLKKLVLWSSIREDLFSLRQYTEILAKNKFDSLEHLKLSISDLSSARSPPFNLSAALAQTGNNLKTLDLELILFIDRTEENLDWFNDLSPFPFPNLTEFNFSIDMSCCEDVDDNPFYLKFDFGTLKGMPMLKKLEINIKNHAVEEVLRNLVQAVLRKPGIQDWVFEGDRNRFLPTGVIVDYQYSANDPILCNNLKEFTFIGWSLTEEDARLLSSWFPNLTHLEAEVNHEALPILLENWPQLEKLVIHTDKLISLWKLRPLKEKKKHLRIFQRFLKDMVVTDESVELKEQNGWLFFTKSEFGIDNN